MKIISQGLHHVSYRLERGERFVPPESALPLSESPLRVCSRCKEKQVVQYT